MTCGGDGGAGGDGGGGSRVLSPALLTACEEKTPAEQPLGSPRSGEEPGDLLTRPQSEAEGRNVPERPREHPSDTS